MKLNPKLKSFWKTYKPIKVLHGGRMSSKSYDTAGVLLYLASTYKLRILCIRRYQNKIDESVYALLKEIINDEEYFKERFTILKSSIVCNSTGSEFIFFGLHRSIDEVVGLQGINITWIEESHTLKEAEWNRLRPTILRTGGGGFCVLVFNPQLETDFVYRNFVMNDREDTLVQQINYIDNPFLSDEAKELIRVDKNNLEEETFNHIYLGYPKSENENAFIKRKWIDAAINANKKLNIENRGIDIIGYDVADDGNDTCVIAHRYGNSLVDFIEWKAKEDELEESAGKAFNYAIDNNCIINYDCIGVGASAGSTFKRLNKEKRQKIKYFKFDAGASVLNPNKEYKPQRKNKDHFENLKAQSWQDVADRLLHTYNAVVKGHKYDEDKIISIDIKDQKKLNDLKKELSSPLKEESKRGLVIVESKKDMKKRGFKSPNCFIAGTKVLTKKGQVNIEDLKVGDIVITPMGESKIIHTHCNEVGEVITNRGLTGTKDHKIFTWNKGWIDLQFLSLCDIIEYSKYGRIKWQIMNLLFTKAKCFQFSTQVDTIVQTGTVGKMLEMKDFYTEEYGRNITGKFQKVIIYIISMVIGGIIKLKTLSVLVQRNIIGYTCLKDLKMKSIGKKIKSNFHMLKKKLKNGISQKREKHGTENMQKNHLNKENTKHINVKCVEKNFNQEEHIRQKHVQKSVPLKEQTKEQKLYTHQHVETVEKSLNMDHLEKEKNTKGVQENAQSQSKIKVYNITLDSHNVFYANGVLVKNCADAFIMAYSNVSDTKKFTNDML